MDQGIIQEIERINRTDPYRVLDDMISSAGILILDTVIHIHGLAFQDILTYILQKLATNLTVQHLVIKCQLYAEHVPHLTHMLRINHKTIL